MTYAECHSNQVEIKQPRLQIDGDPAIPDEFAFMEGSNWHQPVRQADTTAIF